jgi:hypothetical protein
MTIMTEPDRGAMYGWKNLNPTSYPFIYNELVGYSITAFSWNYSELGQRLLDCKYYDFGIEAEKDMKQRHG